MGPNTRKEPWFVRPHLLDSETHHPYSIHTCTFSNRFTENTEGLADYSLKPKEVQKDETVTYSAYNEELV